MSGKLVFVFCAQALFVQIAHSACTGRPNLGAGLISYGLPTPIASGSGQSACAGPVSPPSLRPTPGCSGLGYNGIGYGNAGRSYGSDLGYGSNLAIEVIPTSGGAFPVFSSSSTFTPFGLSVTSENVFDGTLHVVGELPFASVVALDGEVTSGGAGAVSYSCGNGVTAVESVTPSAAAGVVPAHGAGTEAYGAGLGAYNGGGIAPLALLPGAGCNDPVAEIVAPVDGCYPPGIYY